MQEAEAAMTAAEVSVAAAHCLWQILRQMQRQHQMFCFAAERKASDGEIEAAQQTLADQLQVLQMHWQQYSKLWRMLRQMYGLATALASQKLAKLVAIS